MFLLLDSITEKEGKGKWDSKADQIHKVGVRARFLLTIRNEVMLTMPFAQLVDSNGMEVFAKYFRRLLVGNFSQIFPGTNKSTEYGGNYQLLVQEMQKVSTDPEQASKIAETIDSSEGDVFRDFDLSTFMEHFKLDPVAKITLALAFKSVSRSDLRIKGSLGLDSYLNCFTDRFAN